MTAPHNPTDFQLPSDSEYRQKLTLAILELCNVAHQHYAFSKDPVASLVVSAAIAHGCAIGQPFGISQIANLTGMSRRKVYDTLDELIEKGWFFKTSVVGTSHPVYVRNLKGPGQRDAVPIYTRMLWVFEGVCEGVFNLNIAQRITV